LTHWATVRLQVNCCCMGFLLLRSQKSSPFDRLPTLYLAPQFVPSCLPAPPLTFAIDKRCGLVNVARGGSRGTSHWEEEGKLRASSSGSTNFTALRSLVAAVRPVSINRSIATLCRRPPHTIGSFRIYAAHWRIKTIACLVLENIMPVTDLIDFATYCRQKRYVSCGVW